jgi:putative dimethyl sulfoxide reductase chaperone
MQAELRAALCDDLDQLIRLNDRELDGETLAALKAAGFPGGLALAPADEAGEMACANVAAALAALPEAADPASLDTLAADFAAIYLNNRLSASPFESVWLDDDHLAAQQPMFELRDIYAAAGFKVADWRQRFDDHFVVQLHFLRHQLGADAVDGKKMANFIDEHIGYWFPDFARRVSLACDTAFYAALAELTHVWLVRFRQLLDEIYDCPVPPRDELTARINRRLARDKAEIAPIRFMPGAQGPSW